MFNNSIDLQGSLTKSFSTIAYYPDIDTLSELDRSGMPIYTSAYTAMNLFGEDETPLLTSLRSKFYYDQNISAIHRAAHFRDMCAVERFSDVNIIIKVTEVKYEYCQCLVYPSLFRPVTITQTEVLYCTS